jgi:hypothetical protein
MYIKLPKYLFYMALGLNDFDAGKSITRPLAVVGPNGTRFARCHNDFDAGKSITRPLAVVSSKGTRFARCHFRAQKVSMPCNH